MDDNNRITITVCGDGGCEDSYSVTRTIDGQTYMLMLTDTAGQEEYRGLWAASNLRSDAFLLVYDITNANSLDALDYFMDMIEMETEQRLDEGRVPPVKIVAGNKCDLQGARQIRSPQGLEWARKRGCGFMETSAREMVNIEETFALLVRRVVEARRLQATGGAPSAAARTEPLPPLSEKQITDSQMPGNTFRPGGPKNSFWKKLKCW
ncbi:ras-domain-containing protein [Lophium mytilinum]|uniref:Ras-domain-containing protein n=1 Tax=Lophium mytilinum TaxID=390894 RepID=A0A6A6R814_9PEZI|nr:ras-domain-containing protein [Lophium mytilinum]